MARDHQLRQECVCAEHPRREAFAAAGNPVREKSGLQDSRQGSTGRLSALEWLIRETSRFATKLRRRATDESVCTLGAEVALIAWLAGEEGTDWGRLIGEELKHVLRRLGTREAVALIATRTQPHATVGWLAHELAMRDALPRARRWSSSATVQHLERPLWRRVELAFFQWKAGSTRSRGRLVEQSRLWAKGCSSGIPRTRSACYELTHVCFYATDYGLDPGLALTRGQRRSLWRCLGDVALQPYLLDRDLELEVTFAGWCIGAKGPLRSAVPERRSSRALPACDSEEVFLRMYHPNLVEALTQVAMRRAAGWPPLFR